jgi:hypothetical protein
MKAQDFKQLIKESVREAIQEELKDILLEAIRAPKTPTQETYQVIPVGGGSEVTNTAITPQKSVTEKRAMMESIMGDMRRGQDTMSFTSNDAVTMNTFNPQGTMAGGDLPGGNVGLDQIMGLMKKVK